MRTYRVRICRPDKRGYYRPEIGGKRFTVGHKSDISEGEAQRRRDALQLLFDRQHAIHGQNRWANWVLPYAEQLAKGQQIVLDVSDHARRNSGQAAEEALMLDQLRKVGLAVSPTDPQVIAQGERQLRTWIDEQVRSAVAKAIAETTERLGLQGDLAERITGALPDPTASETRTFHEALTAYRKHLDATGKRQDDGQLAPSPRKYAAWTRNLQQSEPDFPLWELGRTKLEEMIARWRNRPISDKSGQRISSTYAKHMLDGLWAVLTWLDESPNWTWELPKGAKRINRTPVALHSDRQKTRARRISGSTYSPEQLATIAGRLSPLGRLIVGLSVNCAMQPAECGRLEVGDYYAVHPETGEPGDWIVFDRPKTHEYGEWLLWKEVADLLQWGIRRSKRIGSTTLIVQQNGQPWYKESWSNPSVKFGRWWQAVPSETDPHIGVVTKLSRENGGFPRHTIKSLRKILPNLFRPVYGKEIADLVNARKVDSSGRLGGRDTDRYADRLYDKVAEAIREFEPKFRPLLDVLADTDLSGFPEEQDV